MNEVESRRIVPMSTLIVILLALFALFQLFFLTGIFEMKSSTVRRVAPWFHSSFLRLVGEHPSSRPAATEKAQKEEKDRSSSGTATVAGFNPEELSVTIEDAEPVVLEPTSPKEETPTSIIPVSKPTKEPEPVDENEPVG